MIETPDEVYKHALRTRKCLICVSYGACDDSTGQNSRYYSCGRFKELKVENTKPFINLPIEPLPEFHTRGDVKPYWPLTFDCGPKNDPIINQEVPALGVFTTHVCYDNVLPATDPSYAALLKPRTYNNGFRGIYDRGIVNVTYVPLYKVANVAERSLRKYRVGAITGEYLLRSFCKNPTIRGVAGYDNYDYVEPVWTDELTVHRTKVNDDGTVERTYRRTAERNLQKHDERDGPHVGDKPEHVSETPYSKEEWKAQLVAHQEAKEARKTAKTGLVEDEDEDSGVAWGVPEFSENYVLGKDPVYRYEPLIKQEVNFYGKGPYKKDYANQKERNYWIGEIYLRNEAAGYFNKNLADEVAEYFDVTSRTVYRCAARVRETHDILQFTRSSEISGDWILKTFKSQRAIVPWKTCDGFRPMSMWLNRGTIDARYDVLRQSL